MNQQGNTAEALIYPSIILILMWAVFVVDQNLDTDFYNYGVLPKTLEGVKGIFFMPFLHSQIDTNHIINNSMPTFVLFGLVIYFYKEISLKVILSLYLSTGFLTWYISENMGSYHIGMSGIIYALFGFVFLSGILRKHTPLWSISLFVIFLYGSMIWGVFPTDKPISWEGHLSGLLTGVVTAIAFRKYGPQASKYNYEIEQELGIEPPDLEGEYNEKLRILREREAEKQQLQELVKLTNATHPTKIIYLYKPKQEEQDNDNLSNSQ